MKYPPKLKGNFLLGAVVIVTIVLSFAWIVTLSKYLEHKHDKNAIAITSGTSPAPASEEAKPASPSPSPSPSPEVFTGFCLNVPILMYHHIQPMADAKTKGQGGLSVDTGTFDSQMAYLKSTGYNSITMQQLAQALIGHQTLAKSVVVTLDDGYKDQFTNAFPIAQKHGIKLNMFIATGLLNNSDYMSWDDLRQIVGAGNVAYDHTWSHANLGAASLDKIKYEITTGKNQLSQFVGQNGPIFAFPYGAENSAAVTVLRENGFIAATSTIPGTTQCDSFLMSLRRTRVGGSSLSAYGL